MLITPKTLSLSQTALISFRLSPLIISYKHLSVSRVRHIFSPRPLLPAAHIPYHHHSPITKGRDLGIIPDASLWALGQSITTACLFHLLNIAEASFFFTIFTVPILGAGHHYFSANVKISAQQASPMAQTVKNLLAMRETLESWVWSLGQVAPLEEEMATHSSILAWRIPWTEALQATVHGVTKSRTWLKQLSTCNVPNILLTVVLAANLNFLKNVFPQFPEWSIIKSNITYRGVLTRCLKFFMVPSSFQAQVQIPSHYLQGLSWSYLRSSQKLHWLPLPTSPPTVPYTLYFSLYLLDHLNWITNGSPKWSMSFMASVLYTVLPSTWNFFFFWPCGIWDLSSD